MELVSEMADELRPTLKQPMQRGDSCRSGCASRGDEPKPTRLLGKAALMRSEKHPEESLDGSIQAGIQHTTGDGIVSGFFKQPAGGLS